MSNVDNKRLIRNIVVLYLRMLLVMGIGLYTVRAILHQLGVVDYGIYNVVGGVVSMFSFLSNTLATSSQRYFSIELAKGDMRSLNQWFCLNITSFAIIILVFVLIAETVGLWFVNTQMTIPAERMFAANVVYQFSIVSFCINFINIPYNALIIAHERMSIFAYFSIIDAILKLIIVFLISISTYDRLIVYAILIFLVSCLNTIFYVIYNTRKFQESRFHFYWNTAEFKELLGFSGWHFLGTSANVIRSQGVNILLNIFFNPAINAARAVAFQVYYAISQLSGNFFTAAKPQIYKSYAAGEMDSLYGLIIRSSILSSFLVSILLFPIFSNTNFVLSLWLKEMPDHVVLFTQLVMINGLIDSTNGPFVAAALATGKIRRFQILVSVPTLLNLPISYLALKLGYGPEYTMLISIILSFVTLFVRAFLLHEMIGISLKDINWMYVKIMIATIVLWFINYLTIYNKATTLVNLILYSIFSAGIVVMVYISLVFSKHDRKALVKVVKAKKDAFF